jgi:hypothetical protein
MHPNGSEQRRRSSQLQGLRHRSQPRGLRHRSGVVLLAALAMVIVVGALAAALFTTAHAEMQQAQTTRAVVDLRNLAEGATTAAEQSLLVAVANALPPPASGTLQLGPHAIPWTVAHIGTDTTDTDPVGIQTIHQHYQLDARADVGQFGHTVHRMVATSSSCRARR